MGCRLRTLRDVVRIIIVDDSDLVVARVDVYTEDGTV